MKGQAGQTLIETLIALAVGVAILSSIIVVVFLSLGNAQFSKNQNLATHYGQEAMELMRSERDESWTDFRALTGAYCLSREGVLTQRITPSCPTNIDGLFNRTVEFIWNGERATVTVTVSWTDTKGLHSSKLVSYYTQWSISR